MYMGHIGIGLGARRISSAAPLWIYLVAALMPDFVVSVGGAIGVGAWANTYAHMLIGVFVEALFMALVCWLVCRSRIATLITALLVVSHLAADLITSYMPLWNRGPYLGLSLYNHHVGDFVLESAVILAGIFFYRKSLESSQRHTWVLVAMFVVLIGFQFLLDFVFNVTT